MSKQFEKAHQPEGREDSSHVFRLRQAPSIPANDDRLAGAIVTFRKRAPSLTDNPLLNSESSRQALFGKKKDTVPDFLPKGDYLPQYVAYAKCMHMLGISHDLSRVSEIQKFIAEDWYIAVTYKENGRSRKTVYGKMKSVDGFWGMGIEVHPDGRRDYIRFSDITDIAKSRTLNEKQEKAAAKALEKIDAEDASADERADRTAARDAARAESLEKWKALGKELLAGNALQRAAGKIIRAITEENWERIARETAPEFEKRRRERAAEEKYYAEKKARAHSDGA